MQNKDYKDNIPSLVRRLNNMKSILAFQNLNSWSTIEKRLGLTFTCVNSLADVDENGCIGNVEAVKDAIFNSDHFKNQRNLIVNNYQRYFIFFYLIYLFIYFSEIHC
jgi:hypothetical protein